LAAKLP